MGCQCSNFDRTHEKDFINSYYEIIHSQAKEYPVLLYSQIYCPGSYKAKELLREKGIPFEYFEIDHMNESEQILNILQNMTGKKHTPFIFFKGEYLGGFHELSKEISNLNTL